MSLVQNLFRDYGDFKIDVPKLEIPDKGITALWGPSGSGKTSLFRILIGLEHCPSLSWTLNGSDLAKLPISKRRLGIMFQNLELFPHMTAEQNILFAAAAHKIPEKEKRARMENLTDILQIKSTLQKRVEVLSGGEKQRVALARALVGNPQFLFLDEPFSSIDEDLRIEARGLVKTVITRLDIPTLLITHDRQDVDQLATSVIQIREGRVRS